MDHYQTCNKGDDRLNHDKIKKVAENHVDWYLNSIRPLLIDHMMHGIKHGLENKEKFEE